MRAVAKSGGDFCYNDTVDGSEILRSPVEVASLSQYLRSFYIPGGAGFLNHLQYTTVK